jgi:D-alanyl-D-alanine-carboxypeptidase/D-alanyl-D-alanine-endopeptidase
VRIHLSLALTLLLASHAAADVMTDAEIRKILVERIDVRKQGIGLVVGVIEPAGRRIVAYGVADEKDKRALNGDTVFEIGSMTKVFTALLLADAVQRGEMALDDPISKYLPADVKVPERGRRITLRDVATHTSGLPRLPSNFAPKDPANPYADYTVRQMYDFLSSYELTREPGTTYEYSNFAVGLLGHMLARRADTDYETLVRTRITTPLAMKSTTITLSDAMKKRFAQGHNDQRAAVPNWDIPTLAGAGALRSTANDLLNFLGAALRYHTNTLSPAMTSLLATRRPTPIPATEIALGWHVTKTADGREIVWHNGGTGGFRSYMAIDPKRRTGVVVLANMSTPTGGDDIGLHLLDPASPLLPAPKVRKEIALDPKILDRYVGNYELAPNFILTITREGNQLISQATGQQKLPLYAESEKDFFVKEIDAQLTFGTDSLVLHQGGRDLPAKRVGDHPAAPKQRKEIAVDPAVLDRYVGRYQILPTFILTLTREGDHLFAQATGQPKFELFAETERDFFLKVVDAQLTFVVDGTGRATRAILHQNGADQDAKRIE